MKNLKLLIIMLTIFAIGLIAVIMVLDIQNDRKQINELQSNVSGITQPENEATNEIANNFQGAIINTPEENQNIEQVSYVDQMEIYLEDFSLQIFNNPEKAYNLLDEAYRIKRFGNIDGFMKYIIEKQNQLSNIKIRQYKVEEEGEYTIYKGTDENGNYYCIRANSNMDYSIILDNYTVQEDYSEESKETKIKLSTEKFILMINSADYTNAYNLLEPNFKATYFPTEQEFINYIKSNWFERNIIASKEVIEEGICIVTMRETISTRANKIEKQFKVTLGEGMNFRIEYDI